MLWHDWIKLFEPHLRDTEELEPFYYELLLNAAKHWDKQNPKRITIESHHVLLQHEGRLHQIDKCYICEQPIDDTIALMPTYRPTHPECIAQPPLPRKDIETFLETGKSTFLSDETVEYIHGVTMRGL
jgi:recombinational DNA repair protein (RecF pathway)